MKHQIDENLAKEARVTSARPLDDFGQERLTRVRVIPELRNYHVASIDRVAPASNYFFEMKYDLVSVKLPSSLSRVSFWKLLWLLLRSKATVLELQEPLWVRLLAKHVCIVFVWKCSRPLARREVVSYAMENNDLASLMFGKRKGSQVLVCLFRWILGAYIRMAYTRLAYASEGSKQSYQSLPFVQGVQSQVFVNLPEIQESPGIVHPRCASVVMVARMERRKGILELMAAWPTVEATVSEARLVIVGDGPESDLVSRWCMENPQSRAFLGALDHPNAMAQLGRARALVLPSVRSGRWREQIGLPIHEGLIQGLTVVTTDETGLATWLSRNGHLVIPGADARVYLSEALIQSLRNPLDPEMVRASLPAIEGRVEANLWLNGIPGASV